MSVAFIQIGKLYAAQAIPLRGTATLGIQIHSLRNEWFENITDSTKINSLSLPEWRARTPLVSRSACMDQ